MANPVSYGVMQGGERDDSVSDGVKRGDIMAKIIAVPEAELQAVIQRREALEHELSKETAIEQEKVKIAELEAKIMAEQKRIHPSKFEKLRESLAGIKSALKEAEAKKRELLGQKII